MAESDQEYFTALKLERLPVEIPQHIASFLPPDSATRFTICSKYFLWVIGHQSWLARRIKDHKAAKWSFFISSRRDLCERLSCYHYEKLHPLKLNSEPHTTWDFRDESSRTQADGVVHFTTLFRLQFQYAQMILKLHGLRATDNNYLDFLTHSHTSDHKHKIPHGHTSARIANDKFFG